MLLQAAIGFSLLMITSAVALFFVALFITSIIRIYKIRDTNLPLYEKIFDVVSKSIFTGLIIGAVVIAFFFVWSMFIDFM